MSERPNGYDKSQMRRIKRVLENALRQVDFMLEEGRSPTDIELRSKMVSGSAAYASILAKNAEHRFATSREA